MAIEVYKDEHLRYLWAAYRKGAFRFIGEDLDSDGFTKALLEWWENFYNNGGELFVLSGRTPKGARPIGVMFVGYAKGLLTRLEAEPHVQWFAWASARNRLEAALAFLVEIKKQVPFRIHAAPEDAPFFYHLGKYGVLRCVGQRRHYFGWGKTAVMFESVGA